MKIRNSAKAVIIFNNLLLVIQKMDEEGPWYLLPGGGQKFGETLVETLERECLEELGAEVEIGKMIFSREYIGMNHEFAEHDSKIHQVEFYFSCKLKSELNQLKASKPDNGQVGVSWVSLEDSLARIYPKFLLNALLEIKEFKYFGDLN